MIFIVLLALGWEALRRRTAREFPMASHGDLVRATRARLGGALGSVRRTTGAGAGVVVRQAGAFGSAATAEVRQRTGRGSAPAEAAPPAPAADDKLQQLERLAALRAAGVLDDAELSAEKARILAQT